MAKFQVHYTEVYHHTYIVDADTEEEAQEKMESAAENISGLITTDDFDYWDIEVEREASAIEVRKFDALPEETKK